MPSVFSRWHSKKSNEDNRLLFYNILPKSKYFVALTSLVATVSCPLQATSAVATGVLSVSATITDSCTVTSTGLEFVGLETKQDLDNLAFSEISIICTSAKSEIGVYLNNGENFGAGNRNMKDTSSTEVAYSLYTDEARSESVSPDVAINSNLIEFQPNVAVVLTVYGTVEAGVYAAGNYSDTVTITVNYPPVVF